MADADNGRQVIRPGTVRAPEFPVGMDWLNTDGPLTMRQLRGKIVLLDFWTHCCINCLHALRELERLERRHGDVLVVIGVHSAKFDAERSTESVREAVLRNGIQHPVVNDSEMRIWGEYAIRAWPSFILVDPLGRVFGTHSGERLFDLFDMVITQMAEEYRARGILQEGPFPAGGPAVSAPDSLLRYPGKVLVDEPGRRLFIADTGHHRIVVADLDDGSVLTVIGSGRKGLLDGPTETASLAYPQGMALRGDSLFIADTGNHAVRQADLAEGTVTTLVGDGSQDLEWGSQPESLQGARLNSPWDLELAHGVLFVAMAGNHRIFGIDLEGGYIAGHAGSGQEDHVDGPLLAAALAQPSGLTSDGTSLFVADSEVSSVRAVALDPRGGHVRTVVGRGLFDFGDRDGSGAEVRLQHPMGVAFSRGSIYVADTYNSKIKAIAVPALTCSTLAGTGRRGLKDGPGDGAMFDEPGGLSCSSDRVFVADTNNHAIRTVDLATGRVSTWPLRRVARLTPEVTVSGTLPPLQVRPGRVLFSVRVQLPAGHAYSSDASSGIVVRLGERVHPVELVEGQAQVQVEIHANETVRITTMVYFCREERLGTCLYSSEAWLQPVQASPSGVREVGIRLDARLSG